VILGETGTGKGVLARWLHRNGPRSDEAFVEINCASLSREFLESEMFGHEKGSFTGAVTAKQGLLEVAHRGVAFLDEIGDMDQQVQPRLLKVLEEKRFRRLGEVRDRQVDVQLIAATHQDLAELVRQQRFRSDLYFRISGVPLRVPALRERPEDIPLLARALIDECAAELGRRGLHLTPEAERALEAYSWPGNVRELHNVLERAALLCSSTELRPSDLHFEMAPSLTPAVPLEEEEWLTLAEVEKRHIVRVLEKCGGRVPDAARSLGVPRSTLYDRLKQLGLSRSTERHP
jgi:DNA-binding NtrC family response regulator